MRSVFHIEIESPIKQSVGVFSNKSIAFENLLGVAKDNTVIVDESSDKYLAYHKKQINYINFTKYFKEAKNKTKLSLKIMSDSDVDNPIVKKVTCTMFLVNHS